MARSVFICIMIPFLGTALGACTVFFLGKDLSPALRQSLSGFAAGIMAAASVWSLLIPAMERSQALGCLSFLPAVIGFWLGMVCFLLLDRLIPQRCPPSCSGSSSMLMLAVTIHNLPEGMAVGAVCAGWLADPDSLPLSGVLTLALGIAVQNFPEGAIISLPLRAQGANAKRSALYGTLSGIVEPLGALLTILLSRWLIPLLPYLLSFAAGAMFFVVLEELVPELREGDSQLGLIWFTLGFTLMLGLDAGLG
ncbi:MAG: ZIP family metal transporter [Oscillospiraceae bacterium]|nr:ZIP family metal transporter [Oscillospiraceae bacterium]